MDHGDFYTQLLDLHAPWQVLDVTIDQPSKRVDIHLGFGEVIKKGLIGFTRVKDMFGIAGQPVCPQCHSVLPKNDGLRTVSVRHLPVAGFATYLHVPSPGTVKSNRSDCICMQSFVATGTQCTVAMRSHVVALAQAVSSTQAVLRLAGITEDELHEIIKSTKIASAAVAHNKDTLPHADSIEGLDIPPVDHPHWQHLITGKLSLQTNSVPLRMLLQHVRVNFKKSPGSEAGIAGAKSLRQFFARNRKSLKQEIDQLNNKRPSIEIEVAGSRKSLSGDDNLPAETALVWQRLVNGDQHVKTNMVGLQMLLEQVRKSVQKDSSIANCQAGIRSLHHFFIKHKVRLSQEITQLTDDSATSVGQTTTTTHATGRSLPAERDPVWSRLISGEIELQSKAVSLQLLLGRVRQKIGTNATEAQRNIGAQILRNYFVRNQQRHSDEIRLLISEQK
jgi:hypothetical protein